MITDKSKFLKLMVSPIMIGFVIGALSMIWPCIIALLLGVLLLLQSFAVDQRVVLRSRAEVNNILVIVASSRRPELSVEFS